MYRGLHLEFHTNTKVVTKFTKCNTGVNSAEYGEPVYTHSCRNGLAVERWTCDH